jgi:hypothetical protein
MEIALLLKWRPKRRPIEGAGEHCKGLFVIDVLKLIDEITQLDFAGGKRHALNQPPQKEFGSKPEMLLELRARPDRYIWDAQFCGRQANLIATLGRNSATAYKLEGVRLARHSIDLSRDILLGLRLCQAAAIDALNNGAFVRFVVERTYADDIAPLVASRLAEPSEISPAVAKVIGEHEALELAATEIGRTVRAIVTYPPPGSQSYGAG